MPSNFKIMNPIRIFSTLLLTSLLWMGCERIIPFSAEDSTPLVVLYAALEPDMPIEAFVSKSVGILDNGEPILLDDAQVWVEDSLHQVLDTLISMGLGMYRAPNTLGQEGMRYTVHARSSVLAPVFGTAQVPMIPAEGAVDSINYAVGQMGGPGPGSSPFKEYSFQILDDGQPGYYQIEAYDRLRGQVTIPEYSLRIETDDPLVNGSGFGGNQYKDRLDISNASFLGGSHTLTIRVFEWDFTGMEVLFKLKKVDEATFFYQRSWDAYNKANGNPFAQPVSVYSNVTDGLGVVSGMAYRWILP